MVGAFLLWTSAACGEDLLPIGLQKQLLVDDYLISEKRNVSRSLGKVTKHGVVLEPSLPTDYDDNDPHGNPVSPDFGFMTSVLWNEDAEKFQMWYIAWRHAGTGYAESTDGIHWTKPSIGVGVTDEEPGNIIKRAQSFSCAIDPTVAWGHPEKFKAGLDSNLDEVCQAALAYSADGIHWNDYNNGAPVTGRAADFDNQILWDPIKGKYRLMTRTDMGAIGGPKEYRAFRIMYHRTNDLMNDPTNWETVADRIVVDDPLGQLTPDGVPRLQFHWVTCWIYEGIYFNLISLYTEDSLGMDSPECDEVIDCYIGTGRDGVNFDRGWIYERKPFIPRGGAGDFDLDRVLHASEILTVGDEHWIYYTGRNEHRTPGFCENWQSNQIGLAKLPLDRFVCLEAGDEWGQVTTKPFTLDGDTLEVNIDASEGGFLVEILDADNQPYVDSEKKLEFDWDNNRIYRNVDGLRLSPRWRGDRNLESLVGKVVRLRFHLRNAKLYAFQIKSEN